MKAGFHAHGRVQGVGFRWYVLREAQALELRGWVRNEGDGTVSGEAAGPDHLLALFRERLEAGPPHAHVSRLDWWVVVEGQSLPHPFEIRR